MEIILKNIQSIKEAAFEFPDTGLVQLIGDNSNGKSILIKAFAAISMLKILDNDERRALINDNSDSGSITIQYKGKILVVKLHEDRNKCIVALYRSNDDKVIRTFRDGGIAELLEEFGFRTYDKNAVCLQVFETFGVMPFVNQTASVNFNIVEAVTTDTIAQQFLSNFKNITREKAKKTLDNLNLKIEGLTREKQSMVMFDYEAYGKLHDKMKEIYEILKYIEPMEISYINLPPKITLLNVKAPDIRKIKFIKVVPVMSMLVNLSDSLQEMKTIREGKCPVCGRALVGNHEEVYS